MSSCAQSYGSFDETAEADEEFFTPKERNVFTHSYAEAAKQAPSTNLPSAMDFSATEKELRTIIATLQTEVNRLKGAQTPSTVTERSSPDPETAKLNSRFDAFEDQVKTWMVDMSDMLSTTKGQKHPPSSESVAPQRASPSQHQAKRADTRHTPTRQLDPAQYSSPQRHHLQHPGSQYSPSYGYMHQNMHIPPQELFADNGDGSRYSVGYHRPHRGQPGWYPPQQQLLTQPSNQLIPHPTMGQPSPSSTPMSETGSPPPSLPAAGAQTYHA